MKEWKQAKKWTSMKTRNKFDIYSKLMVLGHRAGCHQRSDRSFHWHGYQFPVCARCTGVLVGYLVTLPLYFIIELHYIPCIVACSIMFLDWLVQYKKIRESTNIRRLITGILGGFGVMGIQILFLRDLFEWITQMCS